MANLVVKDHSRLGRNRLVVGQLLEEDFVRLNVCRYSLGVSTLSERRFLAIWVGPKPDTLI